MSEVVFIGTSDAFGAGGRRQSAVLVRGPRGAFLLDCGATTNTGLSDLGIQRNEIETILVSHFHADHFAGIPLFLLAAIYEDRRTTPLRIAGPPDVEQRVSELARAMGHPIERQMPFALDFTEVPEGSRFEIGPASVESFETQHQLEANPHGYRVTAGGPTVVYSGDTGWFDALPQRAAGADLFICECTYEQSELDFHLNHELLVDRKHEFDCGRMILTHLGREMTGQRGNCAFETADDGLVVKL